MRASSTQLTDRILRIDGVVGVSADKITEMIVRGVELSKIRVLSVNDDVEKFNSISSDEKINVYSDNEDIDLSYKWLIPEEYMKIDLDKYVQNLINSLPTEISEIGEIRLKNELQEFKRRNMLDFLRTIIFIVSVLKSKNIICGVGRGSSCASYLLFKIGLHSVDSLKYNISLTEFFHD
jgi:DNA polymerase III alpha subunit